MIIVHRFYLGHSFNAAGRGDELLRLFDGLPEFLHTVTGLSADEIEEGRGDPDAARASVKVAMAQCHAALVWGGGTDPAPNWTARELLVARTGFRRPIPVVAVVPETGGISMPARRSADRVVGWDGRAIALAVTEVTAAAVALRRSGIGPRPAMPNVDEMLAPLAATPAGAQRPLPVAEIMDAFARLKARRLGKSPLDGTI